MDIRISIAGLALLALSACTSTPWAVHVANATTVDVPRVDCTLTWSGSGASSGGGPLDAGNEFAVVSAPADRAPEVEVHVTWAKGEKPQSFRIVGLWAGHQDIVVRLVKGRGVELGPVLKWDM